MRAPHLDEIAAHPQKAAIATDFDIGVANRSDVTVTVTTA
jgi:hypothetical protein